MKSNLLNNVVHIFSIILGFLFVNNEYLQLFEYYNKLTTTFSNHSKSFKLNNDNYPVLIREYSLHVF